MPNLQSGSNKWCFVSQLKILLSKLWNLHNFKRLLLIFLMKSVGTTRSLFVNSCCLPWQVAEPKHIVCIKGTLQTGCLVQTRIHFACCHSSIMSSQCGLGCICVGQTTSECGLIRSQCVLYALWLKSVLLWMDHAAHACVNRACSLLMWLDIYIKLTKDPL